MYFIMKFFLNSLIFLSFGTLLGQNSIYILSYNTQQNFDDLKKLSNIIGEKTKKKVDEITIVNYLSSINNTSIANENWNEFKIVFNYNELPYNCSSEPCKTILDDISRYRKGFVNKLLFCGAINCPSFNSNIETAILADINPENIAKKIADETKLNKKSKINFIIVIPPLSYQKSSVKFESSILTIKNGESNILNPIITGEGIKYQWSPSDGLSCVDCSNPAANPKQTTVYTLKITDNKQCESDPTSITVVVENGVTGKNSTGQKDEDCKCSDEDIDFRLIDKERIQILKDKIGEQNVFLDIVKKNPCNNQHLKLYRNTQSEASFLFDLPFSGSLGGCITHFKWKIYRQDDPSINMVGEKEDIENIGPNSGNKYVNNGYFTFRLNVTKNFKNGKFTFHEKCNKPDMNDKATIYRLEVTFLNHKELECGTITSDEFSFSDCSMY